MTVCLCNQGSGHQRLVSAKNLDPGRLDQDDRRERSEDSSYPADRGAKRFFFQAAGPRRNRRQNPNCGEVDDGRGFPVIQKGGDDARQGDEAEDSCGNQDHLEADEKRHAHAQEKRVMPFS